MALAKLGAAPFYCPLAHASVRALGLDAKTLPDIPEGSSQGSDEHANTAKALKANLTAPEMLEFAEFVVRAEAIEWRAFKKHRANVARYVRLDAYYTAVEATL